MQASLLTTLVAGESVDDRAIAIAVLLGVGGFLGYLGIGAASSNVEPAIGPNSSPSGTGDPERDE